MAIMDTIQLNLITEITTNLDSNHDRKRNLDTSNEPNDDNQKQHLNHFGLVSIDIHFSCVFMLLDAR